MKELEIHSNEAGQRFDKFLKKYLKKAPDSFIYKMLRKKNIVLNKKKADGKEILSTGDKVKFFLSDETIEKFSDSGIVKSRDMDNLFFQDKGKILKPDILYEDSQVIFFNKPSGVLSQKAKHGDFSMAEYVVSYLLKSAQMTEEELFTFRPSVCNRLDRNTSGIISAGKTLSGLQELSELFRKPSESSGRESIPAVFVQSGLHTIPDMRTSRSRVSLIGFPANVSSALTITLELMSSLTSETLPLTKWIP